MSIFDRYLSLWVALTMAARTAIGSMAPPLVLAIAAAEVALRRKLTLLPPSWTAPSQSPDS